MAGPGGRCIGPVGAAEGGSAGGDSTRPRCGSWATGELYRTAPERLNRAGGEFRPGRTSRARAVDSAGTGGWHAGLPPDARAQRHAALRGYDLSKLRARRIGEADFDRFDLVLAMDEDNLADLVRLKPADGRAELRLFGSAEVPDPYHGAAAGFEHVLDLIEAASDAWAAELARRLEAEGT